MPFLRFSRDKRGVESFTLVHTTTNRRGKTRPRVLYFFRTPPEIRMGREPFDPELRRALEQQNPDITFDWRAIVETPIPSADADKWRERRRAERAAKHAARAESAEEALAAEAADAADPEPEDGEPPAAAGTPDAPAAALTPESLAPQTPASNSGDPNRKRRRRRRGGGRGPNGSAPNAAAPGAPSAPASHEPSGD